MSDKLKDGSVFRKEVLDSLQEKSSSSTVAVISPKAWYFLATCVLVLLSAVIWAFTYRVSEFVEASGICLVPGSVHGVTAVANEQIDSITVASGDRVNSGDHIATIDMEGVDTAISKAQNLLLATQEENANYQNTLDQWLSAAVDTNERQASNNRARLAEVELTIADAQALLELQLEQSLAVNDRLQLLYGEPTSQTKQILESMRRAGPTNSSPAFSDQQLAEQSRLLAEDERSLLDLQQQRIQIQQDQLDGQSQISELQNQKRNLEQANRSLMHRGKHGSRA